MFSPVGKTRIGENKSTVDLDRTLMEKFDSVVIGAGLSGLAAARELQNAGQNVVIYEKSRAVGGRLASRRAEIDGQNLVFDHGAQNIKSQGTALEIIAQKLVPDDRIFIQSPVCLYEGAEVFKGDPASNAEPKWSCRGGITKLPKALAQGLDVRFNSRIVTLQENADEIILHDENGPVAQAASVILTAPAPQCADLLEASELKQNDAQRIANLRNATFHNCLSVMLHFVETGDADWYALLARDRKAPLLWLARENAKYPDTRGTSLVAQIGPDWSHANYDASDEAVLAATLGWIAPLLPQLQAPVWKGVKRWRFSQPRETVSFDEINAADARIIICGDATAKGRATNAYDSGIAAARRILA